MNQMKSPANAHRAIQFMRWWRQALCAILLLTASSLVQSAGAKSPADPDFTIVAIPDTQGYTAYWAGATMRMFSEQLQWAAENKEKENIEAVIGLGDIINNYLRPMHEEWRDADAAYAILDGARVPYVPTIGNHDYDVAHDMSVRVAKSFNQYFGPSRLADYAWYGGGYPQGSNENFYITFTSGERSYLVIALELYPRDSALAWAQGVLDANPDKEVIVATHLYLNLKGQRIVRRKDSHFPPDANDAEDMWNKFIKVNKNIFLVLCGHVTKDGSMIMSRRSDVGDHGNTVHQLLADYQGTLSDGGRGFMRILKFRPSKGVIEVRTYSPYLDKEQSDETNQFTLQYSAPPVATRRHDAKAGAPRMTSGASMEQGGTAAGH